MPQSPEIFLNGVDINGHPILPPLSREELVEELRRSLLREKEEFVPQAKTMGGFRSARAFFQDLRPPHDPTRAGWALLMHKDDESRLRPLLEPLISHRRLQMRDEGRVEIQVFDENLGPEMWLHRRLIGADHPYYMLIAAPPERVSFRFQHLLDVKCAVGRLWFESDQEFKNYVTSLISAESADAPGRAAKAVLFAPDHDGATHLSCTQMAEMLWKKMKDNFPMEPILGTKATKDRLSEVLTTQDEKPGLVFTASHGLAVAKTDPQQKLMQGSLVCQDSNVSGYFGGDKIDENCNLRGGIFFSFACYGAGTPSRSDFCHWIQRPDWRAQLQVYEGPADFLAHLPTRLLGISSAALAFVGHIDPAWTYSFLEPSSEEQRIYPFQAAVMRILQGAPVGYAVKEFNEEYSTLNTDLLNKQTDYEQMTSRGQVPSPFWDTELADVWMRRTDYQNYVILGDPAAKLNVI